MKKITFILLLACWVAPLGAAPAWAGTQVKARLEYLPDAEAWVELTASIAKGRLRLDFKGPKSRGTILYDEKTSLVIVVDDLQKTVLPLSKENQGTLKLIGDFASGRIEAEIAKAGPGAQKIFTRIKEGSKALLNGAPALKEKGVQQYGFACDLYRTELKKKKTREAWMVPPKKAGMPLEDYGTFLSLAHLALDFLGPQLFQFGADADVFRRRLSSSRLPVFALLYKDGKPSSRFQVSSIQTGSLSADVFNPPAGYRMMSLMDMVQKEIQKKP